MARQFAKDDEGGAKARIRRGAERIHGRTYYMVLHKAFARPIGMNFLNEAEVFANGPPLTLVPPDLKERGFRSYPVTPRFHLSRRFGRIPCDIEQYGSYWLVSDRAKQVLSQLSPADFAFMALDTGVDAGQGAVKFWLCDVIRMMDAIDLEKSNVKILKDDLGEDFTPENNIEYIVFKENMLESYRAFRLYSNSYTIVCDDIFKDKIKSESITGLRFVDISPR